MPKFARIANSASVQIININPPFSNFRFIRENHFFSSPVSRLFSQARQHQAQGLIFEELISSEDLLEEDDEIKCQNSEFLRSESFRISFFSKYFDVKHVEGYNNDNFLGYAIIKKNIFKDGSATINIFDSVMKPSRHLNNFIRGCVKWNCSISGQDFSTEGYLYAQQNGISNKCAHVALRTVIPRYTNGNDVSYKRMNSIINLDLSRDRLRGLNRNEMQLILDTFGIGSEVVGRTEDVPLRKNIYGFIESGYPAIIVFETGNVCHAIPVIGHTFNEDTWVPRAESPYSYFEVGKNTKYTPSESWADMFIIHDDNFGSNFCVPKEYFEKENNKDQLLCKNQRIIDTLSSRYFQDSSRNALGILTFPKECLTDSIDAETIGANYLLSLLNQMPDEAEEWARRLESYSKNNLIVMRPMLIKGSQYVGHLKGLVDWKDNKISNLGLVSKIEDEIGETLIWMIEVSIPELFSANKRKLGEVILKATISPTAKLDFTSFYMARIPGFFAVYKSGVPEKAAYNFDISGINSHVELFDCKDSKPVGLL